MTFRWAFGCAAFAFLLNLTTAARAEAPRELSPAEQAAASWALEYLQSGPGAWLDDLAAAAPLRSAPDPAAALELRAGPPAGARWRLATSSAPGQAVFHILFPSGLEETLRLTVASEDGKPRIAAVEAGWEAANVSPLGAPPAASPPAGAADEASPSPPPSRSRALPLAAGVAGLLALALAFFLPSRRLLFGAAGLALLVAGAVLLLRPHRSAPAAAAVPAALAGGPAQRPADDLLAWRRRLALGAAKLEALPAGRGESQLWAAEEALLANDLELAATALAAAGEAAASPAAYRLKARLAARQGDGSGALAAYLELVRRWPHDEVHLVEAIDAAYRFAFERQVAELTAQLREIRPRWAEALRLLALADAIDGLPANAAASLEQALRLAPHRRSDLIASRLEAYLIEAAPSLAASLQLGDSAEPLFACPAAAAPIPALPLPAGVVASRVGHSSYFAAGPSELEIPGGCALAPAGAETLGGEAWLERRDLRRRQASATLGREIASRGGSPSPAERRQLGEAVEALLAGQQFAPILELTGSLDAGAQGALSDAARRARVQALHREGRRKEAFGLLLKLVGSDFDQQRSDPGMLFDFAELMVQERQYDLAARLFAAADRRLPMPVSGDRIYQLNLEKKLIDNSLHLERPPFKIYFGAEADPRYVEDILGFLERERQRLGAFIPAAGKPRPIEVLLLDPRDFRQGYGGAGVELLGLYDGRIRVPLGRLRQLNEIAASILSHELAHALIADASGDNAPHWLHEGLAQMIEAGRRDANPILAMKERGKWLAFPLVEAALSGMATPTLAHQGYEEALWVAIYLQKTQGPKIFGKLLESCRRGEGAESALARHLGIAPRQLDEKLFAWAAAGNTPLWETGPVD